MALCFEKDLKFSVEVDIRRTGILWLVSCEGVDRVFSEVLLRVVMSGVCGMPLGELRALVDVWGVCRVCARVCLCPGCSSWVELWRSKPDIVYAPTVPKYINCVATNFQSIVAKLIFVYKTKCDVICINMWNFKIIFKEFYLKLPEKLQV